MAASTYWADKLVIQFLSTCSNRREFLKATTAAGIAISAFGGIGALSGFASVQTTQEKNTDLQREIYALMWEHKVLNLSASERIARLIEILDKAISGKDPVTTQAAAEGLMMFADDRIFDALKRVHDKFPENIPLRRLITRRMHVNFFLNPSQLVRKETLRYYGSKMADPAFPVLIQREMYSGVIFINNMSYRMLRYLLRNVRLADSSGVELVMERWLEFMIQHIYPPFKAFDRFGSNESLTEQFMLRRFGILNANILRNELCCKKSPEEREADEKRFRVTEEKMAAWRKELNDNNSSPDVKINALLNLDEREPEPLPFRPGYLDLMLKMLDNESVSKQEKWVILSILGNVHFPGKVIDKLLEFLGGPDKDLALAAAKTLRAKPNLPADKILTILKRTKDVKLRQQLGDQVLSSLGSPDAFGDLVLSITMSDTAEEKTRRSLELNLWYWGGGIKRDEMLDTAIQFVSPEIREVVRNHLREWLRNTSAIKIWTDMPMAMFTPYPATMDGLPFGESALDNAIHQHLLRFEQITKELVDKIKTTLEKQQEMGQ